MLSNPTDGGDDAGGRGPCRGRAFSLHAAQKYDIFYICLSYFLRKSSEQFAANFVICIKSTKILIKLAKLLTSLESTLKLS